MAVQQRALTKGWHNHHQLAAWAQPPAQAAARWRVAVEPMSPCLGRQQVQCWLEELRLGLCKGWIEMGPGWMHERQCLGSPSK